MSNIPGHYHAEGDPPDTVRYWDGSQWVGDPMPAPPTASTPPPPPPGGMAAAGAPDAKFGTVGVRIGAAIIDAVISGILLLAIFVPIILTADDASATSISLGGIVIGLVYWAFYAVFLVAQFGGTPGKLILGLRITEEDGETPVGYRGAAMRSIPGLLGNALGNLGGLISFGFAIASIFMVNSDDERRSAYDRIGGTRVVRK